MRLEIAHDEPGCDHCQDAGEAEMISQQEGTVGSDGRKSYLNEML